MFVFQSISSADEGLNRPKQSRSEKKARKVRLLHIFIKWSNVILKVMRYFFSISIPKSHSLCGAFRPCLSWVWSQSMVWPESLLGSPKVSCLSSADQMYLKAPCQTFILYLERQRWALLVFLSTQVSQVHFRLTCCLLSYPFPSSDWGPLSAGSQSSCREIQGACDLFSLSPTCHTQPHHQGGERRGRRRGTLWRSYCFWLPNCTNSL